MNALMVGILVFLFGLITGLGIAPFLICWLMRLSNKIEGGDRARELI
jgi:hypothetical protein